MTDSLHQAVGLNLKNGVHVFEELIIGRRNERIGVDSACKPGCEFVLTKIDGLIFGIRHGSVAGHTMAFVRETVDVDFGSDAVPVAKRRIFREHGTIFTNHMVSAENHVLRTFGCIGTCIDITAQQTAGSPVHQRPAIILFADDFIGSGRIGNQSCPCKAETGSRSVGSPGIFTDFDTEAVVFHVVVTEEQMRAKRNLRAADLQCVDTLSKGFAGGELTHLVVFSVGRDVSFRNKPQNPAVMEYSGTVVKLAEITNRKTDDVNGVKSPGGVAKGHKTRKASLQQGIGEKQIPACIAGNAKLRQAKQIHFLFVCIRKQRQNLLNIGGRIGDMHDMGGS